MLRRKNIPLDSHTRLRKNKETEMLILLERCLQIPKDERLGLREKIKAKDQQVISIMQRYKKQSDLTFLQIELRRFVLSGKKQNYENKPGNIPNSSRQAVQIKVQVIPLRVNRLQKQLNLEFERERKKQIAMMEIVNNQSSYADFQDSCDSSLAMTYINSQRVSYKNFVSSHKVSSQTICPPNRNACFQNIYSPKGKSLYGEKLREQNKYLKEKTNDWYQQFKAKFSDKHYRNEDIEQYNGQHNEEQFQSNFQQNKQQNFGSRIQEVQQDELNSDILDQINPSRKSSVQLKQATSELKLKLPIIESRNSNDEDQLFSFRRREAEGQIKESEIKREQSKLYKSTSCNQNQDTLCSPKRKFGEFYKRLKQELRTNDYKL